jgi:TetR/AcrR family transcriptional regulator, cholesterol catabolism regulator
MIMTKGDETRAALLKTARDLFSEKGFAAVTMGDFCQRHGLSRGGLYRHFSSPREIFTAMLDADKETASHDLEAAIQAGISARQLFTYFLRQQKQEILHGGGRLSVAVYEFCTTNPDQKGYLEDRYEAAVGMLEKLIRYGQARGEYKELDATAAARHIIVFLEGFKLSSAVITFTEAMIEDQLRYIEQMLVLKD